MLIDGNKVHFRQVSFVETTSSFKISISNVRRFLKNATFISLEPLELDFCCVYLNILMLFIINVDPAEFDNNHRM